MTYGAGFLVLGHGTLKSFYGLGLRRGHMSRIIMVKMYYFYEKNVLSPACNRSDKLSIW